MMKDTMDIAQAAIENVLRNVQEEIKELARVYDSRDLFGIAYGKFAEKINSVIDDYIEK